MEEFTKAARTLHILGGLNGEDIKTKRHFTLHELIHSVSSRAMKIYNTELRDEILNFGQIKAIKRIKDIYKDLNENYKAYNLFDEETGKKYYGLENEDEILAELANPIFREKLKKINVFEKIIDCISKII